MTEHVNLEDNPVAAAWLAHCAELRKEIAKLQAEYDRGTEAIKDAMGDSSEARLGGVPVVTWRTSQPAKYIDTTALRAELPDVAARFTRLKAAARPFKILDTA